MSRAGSGRLRDAVRALLWPLPVLGVTAAVLLGLTLPLVDEYLHDDLPGWLTPYLFGGGGDAARTVLATIAGSLITVTSLTFSLTVVTLQLASSQFSPRLLRTFSSDRFVQSTLALLLGTFTFSVTVLRTVRTGSDAEAVFVPQVSVTTAFLLTIASVIALVLFLAHLARQIRVESMLRDVHRDASATVRRVLGESPTRPTAAPRPPDGEGLAVQLTAASSGFLLGVDEDDLVAAAVEADAVISIDRTPGSSLIRGTPVGAGWPRGPGAFDEEVRDRLGQRVARAILTGSERTAAQDTAFGLRQLTDVATKALSPGINDPTTAVHALGHASALLCEMVDRDLGPTLLRDRDDVIRVVIDRPGFADLLELAVQQPRRYGAGDPQVLSRIAWLLREVGWLVTQPDQQRAVADQLARLRRTVVAQDYDDHERADLAALIDAAGRSLAGEWPVDPLPR